MRLGAFIFALAFRREMCYCVDGATDKRQAVGPLSEKSGALLCPLIFTKGGLTMVTYSDLIQVGILVVGIISLFVQVHKEK